MSYKLQEISSTFSKIKQFASNEIEWLGRQIAKVNIAAYAGIVVATVALNIIIGVGTLYAFGGAALVNSSLSRCVVTCLPISLILAPWMFSRDIKLWM
jgi:hypothetical protein